MRKNRGTIPERKRKKHREDSFAGRFRRGLSYLKDYRFSRILVRYFLLLFVCLVLPATGLSFWYGRQLREIPGRRSCAETRLPSYRPMTM